MNRAFLISNIEEYGYLVAYCIDHNISVWGSYWYDRRKGERCYFIDFYHQRLFAFDYSSCPSYFEIVCPVFDFDQFGNVVIKNLSS